MAEDTPQVGPSRFSGEYEHSVDDKGRLTLPARIRDGFGAAAFLTRGLDGCLFLYPEPRWLEIANQVRGLPLTSYSARLLTRMIHAGVRCDLDRVGRILIPNALRKSAKISEQVVVVGVDDRVELWAPERWAEAMDVLCNPGDAVAEEWKALGV